MSVSFWVMPIEPVAVKDASILRCQGPVAYATTIMFWLDVSPSSNHAV